jgi:hypothetical protein
MLKVQLKKHIKICFKELLFFLLLGIYPSLALLNHSCDPNISKYFDGAKVIALSNRIIFKGKFNLLGNIKPVKTLSKHVMN